MLFAILLEHTSILVNDIYKKERRMNSQIAIFLKDGLFVFEEYTKVTVYH